MAHGAVRFSVARPLPLNGSLLRGIDVLAHTALEEKRRHVVREERPRLRVHHVEPVVVDQHGLLFQPITPALLTDFLNHACPDLPGEWSAFETAARLSAARASHVLSLIHISEPTRL